MFWGNDEFPEALCSLHLATGPRIIHCWILTDCSKTDKGPGSVIYIEGYGDKLQSSPSDYASALQAKVFAILKAMDSFLKNRWIDKSWIVCSEGPAAFKALTSPLNISRRARPLKSRLSYVEKYNEVFLLWISRHTGNVTSDHLVGESQYMNVFFHEPFIALVAELYQYSSDKMSLSDTFFCAKREFGVVAGSFGCIQD